MTPSTSKRTGQSPSACPAMYSSTSRRSLACFCGPTDSSGWPKSVAAACLHFDEHERVAVTADQVDLAEPGSLVAVDDPGIPVAAGSVGRGSHPRLPTCCRFTSPPVGRDRPEGPAVNRGGAEPPERAEVLGGAVALVPREAVTGDMPGQSAISRSRKTLAISRRRRWTGSGCRRATIPSAGQVEAGYVPAVGDDEVGHDAEFGRRPAHCAGTSHWRMLWSSMEWWSAPSDTATARLLLRRFEPLAGTCGQLSWNRRPTGHAACSAGAPRHAATTGPASAPLPTSSTPQTRAATPPQLSVEVCPSSRAL